MNLRLSMVLRPSSLLILLVYATLIVLISLTPCWYVMVTRIDQRVNFDSQNFLSQLQSEIEHSAKLLHPMNSSSTNLARFLSSTLNTTDISFSDIENKVAPLLYQAFKTVPHLAQISYIGMDGLFFSYYTDHDQALAMYSNSSSSTSIRGASINTTLYYIQPVNGDTGELYGEAMISEPSINASWIGEAVNSSRGHASLGTKWNNDHDLLFLSSARITRTGVISLGFPAPAITDFVSLIGRQGASLHVATKDGEVLVEGIRNTRVVISGDMASFLSVNANGDPTSYEGTVSCKDGVVASVLNIRDIEYLIHCCPVDIMGIESVYVLAVPQNGLVSFVHHCKKKGLMLLSVMMAMIFIATLSFLFINARAARREMHLCASLIKQMEATQQAERKSMNKSLAFASASHDVRASLAGLTGLVEISYEEVVPGSELETNLKQMDACTKDLLGLLNSILDTSKIEAGKMLLEEEEFDLSQLLEDVADLYHPVAMKKGVDLVLDHCNGSVLRYSRIKGDRGKLKQVLCNLLSNAVKFTDEGHIAIRAWAHKPSLQNSIIATNRYSFLKHLSCLFYKKNEAQDDLEAMNSIQQDPNCMDFLFEVDDTGKGIPKEKHKSVFENYVQVKETALGQGGTGLGLGIVQSLVRLMHGDIGIVDKDIGEKGTCFRFNALLTVCETVSDGSTREDLSGSGDRNQAQGQTIHTPSSGSTICSMSPRLPIRSSSSPKPEPSRVVLLIQDEERRRTAQRFMESLGFEVKVVKQWEHLIYTLKKIKHKGRHSRSQSSPGASDLNSRSTSHNSIARAKGAHPLSAMDGTDYIPSIFKKTDAGSTPGFVLIVIDANAGPFSELCRMVSDFKRGLRNPCKVVWLEKPLMRSCNFKNLHEDVFDSNDIVISKPFHGSRLFQVIKLLPEYGGAWQSTTRIAKRESAHDRAGKNYRDSSFSKFQFPVWDRSQVSPTGGRPFQSNEKQNYGSSRGEQIGKETQQAFGDQSFVRSKARKSPVHEGEIQERGDSSNDKPLSGKKFLVVEDSQVLRKVAVATLEWFGATIKPCENGEQAVRLVGEGLTGDFPKPPYDYILMDCEMPIMDGFEATRRIREMEKPYGVRIPIIALTAHTSGKEVKMTIEAGMDVHLGKPIKKEHLLEAIRYIHSKE